MMSSMSLTKMVSSFFLYRSRNYPLLFLSGNGEIDFEEFLTLMTSTEKFLENLRGIQLTSNN